MPQGVVEQYNCQKGTGLVIQENGTQLLVSYSDICGPGWQDLTRGDRVWFRVAETINKILYARDVHILRRGT